MGLFRRPLNTSYLVERLLTNALNLPDYQTDIGPEIVRRILAAERGIARYEDYEQTLDSDRLRARKFKTEKQRVALRNQIVHELVTYPKPADDEEMQLGVGGALPHTGVVSSGEAFLIIGLPAAGKSTLSNKLSEDFGAVVLDSDYAKRKLPEFRRANYCGASIVNKESSRIIWGFPGTDFQDLSAICFQNRYNIVSPRIGNAPKQVLATLRLLRAAGYQRVHLVLISIGKGEATIRALKRFYQTGRYVPTSLILDEFGNDPSYCYYYLRSKFADAFDSLGALIAVNGGYQCLDYIERPDVRSPAADYKFIDITHLLP